jgi:hypothetical protein
MKNEYEFPEIIGAMEEFENSEAVTTGDLPTSIHLDLVVKDPDSVREIGRRSAGRERDDFSLSALRIGVLSLKFAGGQVDADAVRREGDRILEGLAASLDGYKTQLNDGVTAVLTQYFDPNSGRFQERVERLIQKDGELEQLIQRQIGSEGSELADTLALHVGKNSPIMNLLDPSQSNSLVHAIRTSAEEVLQGEAKRILSEFSMDNKDSAMCRMISELSERNHELTGDLAGKIEEIVEEFSLDAENSALSRLVRKVEAAQRTISSEFSLDNDASALSRMSLLVNEATNAIHTNLTLDNEGSALARLKRELLDILTSQNDENARFQRDVAGALQAMKARREEALRSTSHGKDFESAVVDFVKQEAEKSGDIATATGNTVGLVKNCKIGDATVELGPDCVASGVKFVIEAKESSACDLSSARIEIEGARMNRGASVGLFVFSKKTAPADQQTILRYGNDVFVIWDAEDINSDVILKSGLSLAKALCVRESTTRSAEAAEFEGIDRAILAIEKEAKRLDGMRKWTETIKSNSEKILGEVRKMADGLEAQVTHLRDAVSGLHQTEVVAS